MKLTFTDAIPIAITEYYQKSTIFAFPLIYPFKRVPNVFNGQVLSFFNLKNKKNNETLNSFLTSLGYNPDYILYVILKKETDTDTRIELLSNHKSTIACAEITPNSSIFVLSINSIYHNDFNNIKKGKYSEIFETTKIRIDLAYNNMSENSNEYYRETIKKWLTPSLDEYITLARCLAGSSKIKDLVHILKNEVKEVVSKPDMEIETLSIDETLFQNLKNNIIMRNSLNTVSD